MDNNMVEVVEELLSGVLGKERFEELKQKAVDEAIKEQEHFVLKAECQKGQENTEVTISGSAGDIEMGMTFLLHRVLEAFTETMGEVRATERFERIVERAKEMNQ